MKTLKNCIKIQALNMTSRIVCLTKERYCFEYVD